MKKRIAIFQNTLSFNGSAKSLICFLKNVDYKQYDVDLYVIKDGFYADAIPKQVRVIKINRKGILGMFKIRTLLRFNKRHYETKYDIVVDNGGVNNIATLECLSYPYEKRVAWIHTDYYQKYHNEKHFRIMYKKAREKYKYFDQFVCVSEGVKEGFIKLTGIDENKCVVIPNFIDVDEIFELAKEHTDFKVNENKYNLVYLGRLSKQKGLDLLLPIYNEVRKRRKDIHLYIIGSGPQITDLHTSVELLKLTDDVTFLGSVPNPYLYLDKMDGIILYSRYEGQGTVLYEAKALGLEVFIPKKLEKYSDGIKGTDNVYGALVDAVKQDKKRDHLTEYNRNVKKQFKDLISK
jgi:glycosyltransferase involved in cell wall biosynthesis